MSDIEIKKSTFGEFYDCGDLLDKQARRPVTVVLGTRIAGHFAPREILLPHQLYVEKVEHMRAEGHSDFRVHPIYDDGFGFVWRAVEQQGEFDD